MIKENNMNNICKILLLPLLYYFSFYFIDTDLPNPVLDSFFNLLCMYYDIYIESGLYSNDFAIKF